MKPEKRGIRIVRDSGFEYHSNQEYIGSSNLRLYKQSPLHFKESERKVTDALEFGSAYHCLILEPERFEKDYYILDPDERPDQAHGMTAKANAEWARTLMEKYPGVMTKETFDIMQAMRDRLMSDFYIRSLLSKGESEVSHYVDDFNGAKVKVRTDYKKPGVLIDLKTTRDASRDGFIREIASYDLHIQAAYYRDVVRHCDGQERRFLFIAQEKAPPFATNIIQPSAQMLAVGTYEYEILLQQHLKCLATGKYRGYSIFADNKFGVEEVDIPAWKIAELTFNDK